MPGLERIGTGCRRDLQDRIASLVFALCLASAAACGGAANASDAEISTSHYAISGRTHAEVVASIRSNGPRDGYAYGIGFIDFLPDYETKSARGRCAIDKVSVALRIELRLPRWKGDPASPRAVARFATGFARTIEAHEMQHVAIARRHASRMRNALARLSPQESCWDLRATARQAIARVKDEHREAQRAFDRRTKDQMKGFKALFERYAASAKKERQPTLHAKNPAQAKY